MDKISDYANSLGLTAYEAEKKIREHREILEANPFVLKVENEGQIIFYYSVSWKRIIEGKLNLSKILARYYELSSLHRA